MANYLAIARRREQVQRLLIRGLTASEIARSVDPAVDESTVKRDIAWVRSENERWWRRNSTVKARMIRYLKERIDSMREITREAWLVVYEATQQNNLKMRVAGLNAVLGAEKALSELLGFSGITLSDIEVQEKLQQIDEEITEFRRLARIAESNTIST